MKLFVFKSSTKDGLHAFAADVTGKQLPKQFQPWIGTGVVRADANPPHGLSRLAIERSIKDRGFQLWRSQKLQSRWGFIAPAEPRTESHGLFPPADESGL